MPGALTRRGATRTVAVLFQTLVFVSYIFGPLDALAEEPLAPDGYGRRLEPQLRRSERHLHVRLEDAEGVDRLPKADADLRRRIGPGGRLPVQAVSVRLARLMLRIGA